MDTIGSHFVFRNNDAPRARPGYSLLEVLLASTICAVALVPALVIMRDGILATETIDNRHLLLLYGVQKMEQQLAEVAALGSNWPGTAPSPGNFASEGHASIRYTVSRSDGAGSGGITNRLMNITVTTYYDTNGNSALDASEPRTVLTTKISKLATYEDIAGS